MSDAVVPFPVRLSDMRDAELAYREAAPDERLAMHGALTFWKLLTFGERVILERRFPHELRGDPFVAVEALGLRAAFDFRARELVVCMLGFGDEILRDGLDLVGEVSRAAPLRVMALTGTGSTLILDPPGPDGTRRFLYRPSPRPGGRSTSGVTTLDERLKLGNRFEVGELRTSEVLVLASGPPEPARSIEEQTKTMPSVSAGTVLFTPDADLADAEEQADDVRVDMVRFRVLVEAAGNAPAAERPPVQARMIELARTLQRRVGGVGADLEDLTEFTTSSGSRYEVVRFPGRPIELLRHPRKTRMGRPVPLGGVDLLGQSVVVGAPLVINHDGFAQDRVISVIFRIKRAVRRHRTVDKKESAGAAPRTSRTMNQAALEETHYARPPAPDPGGDEPA